MSLVVLKWAAGRNLVFNPQPAAQVDRRSADLFQRHGAAGVVNT